MVILRRFLVLSGLFFWLGGFTFYAAVVVPVGQQVFGHLRQGFVTRQVTVWLNVACAVALLPPVWDLLAGRDPAAWRRRLRWLCWVGMGTALLGLFQLHGRLDELLQLRGFINRDPETFRPLHRLYLWISTAQWGCGLLYLFFMLQAWRAEDRNDVRDRTEVQKID
jgi:hypothetical protein